MSIFILANGFVGFFWSELVCFGEKKDVLQLIYTDCDRIS